MQKIKLPQKKNSSSIFPLSDQLKEYLNLSAGIAIALDRQGRVILINPNGCKILGCPQKDVIGKNWFKNFIPPKIRSRVQATFQKLVQGKIKIAEYFENPVLDRKKQEKIIRWHNAILRDKREKVCGTLSIGEDITERQRIEKQIKESQRTFQAIFNNTYQFTGLMTPEGILLEANQTALDFTGAKIDEVRNKPFWKTPWWSHSKPVQKKLRLSIRQAAKGDFIRYETTVRDRDGNHLALDFSIKSLKDEKGKVILLIPEGRDISGRKYAEQQAYETAVQAEALYSTAPDAVLVADIKRRRILKVNDAACQIFGYSKHEFSKKRIDHLHPLKERARIRSIFNQLARRKKKKVISSVPCVKKSGRLFFADIAGRHVIFEGQNCLIGVFRDISERKRVEEALRENEEKFRSVAEQSPNMIFINQGGRVLYANKQCEKIMGYKLKEFYDPHFNFQTLTHPEDKALLADKYKQHQKGRDVLPYEYKLITKAGKILHVILTTKLIRYQKGKAILGIITDITSQEKAAKKIQENEMRLRALNENLAEGMVYQIESSLDGQEKHFTFVSPAVQKLHGVNVEQALKDSKAIYSQVVKDDQPLVAEREARAAKAMKTFEAIVKVQLPSGIIRWRRFISSPRLSADNKRLLWDGIEFDVTESKRAEEALIENRERLDFALKAARMGVWQFDIIQNKRYFDDQTCHLLGIDPKKFHGTAKEFFGALHPEDRPLIHEALSHTIKKNAPYEPEYRAIWPDGTVHHIAVRGQLVRDRSRKPLKINGMIWDITERKKMEETLKKSEERFKGIATNLPGFVYQFYARKNGEWGLYYVSKRSKEMFGLDPDPQDYFKRFVACIPEEDKTKFLNSISKAVKAVKRWEYEGRFIAPNGEKYIQGISQPQKIGDEIVFNGFLMDITQRRKDEAALQENEQKFRALTEKSPNMIFIAQGLKVVYANDECQKIMGYRPEEYASPQFNFLELVHPDSAALAKKHFDLHQKGREVRPCEYKLIKKNGEMIYCIVATKLIEYSGQRAVLTIMTDITDRKHVEHELQDVKGRLEYLVGVTKTGVDVIDADFNLHYVDPEWQKIYGDFKGRKCYEYFMKRDMVCPNCGIPKALRTKQMAVTEEVLPFENNRVVEVHTIPFQDSNGKWMVGEFNIDITERKRAAEALKESRRQLLQIIDTVPHMIFAKDKEGHFLLVNKALAQMYGKESRDLVGIRHQEVHPVQAEWQRFLETDQEVFRTGRPKIILVENFTDIYGNVRILQTIKIPFKMQGIEETVILGVSVDITEQKKVEEFRNDIVRTVSHELRTPLSIQKEGINLLLDGTGGEMTPEQRTILDVVKKSIGRLSRMIDGLLDISRIEAGKMVAEKEEVDLVNLVKSVLLDFKAKAHERNIELRSAFSHEVTKIYADPDKMIQVLTNLVDNAIKFTEKGSICISVKEHENEVECSVEDTGSGIAQENIPRLFEKFQQFSRMAGPGEKGLGLGLAIVKGIMDMHHGRIWAKSELGKGTHITFVIPKHPINKAERSKKK